MINYILGDLIAFVYSLRCHIYCIPTIQQKKVLYIVEISLDIDYTGIVGISVAGYMLSWKVASMFT